MSKETQVITRKYVLIPEKSDSSLWEKRVYDYITSDLRSRIAFYEGQLSDSKKKEVKEKAKARLDALNEELDAFLEDPQITLRRWSLIIHTDL